MKPIKEPSPVGWWCPGCLKTFSIGQKLGLCAYDVIPIYKPLKKPEPTTWGKSGGDKEICVEFFIENTGIYTKGAKRNPHIWLDLDGEFFGTNEIWAINKEGYAARLEDGDIKTAIQYLEE